MSKPKEATEHRTVTVREQSNLLLKRTLGQAEPNSSLAEGHCWLLKLQERISVCPDFETFVEVDF
jgi:hypothetical protein